MYNFNVWSSHGSDPIERATSLTSKACFEEGVTLSAERRLKTNFLGSAGSDVELFYSAEVATWFYITTSLQVIDPAANGIEAPLLVGLRSKNDF